MQCCYPPKRKPHSQPLIVFLVLLVTFFHFSLQNVQFLILLMSPSMKLIWLFNGWPILCQPQINTSNIFDIHIATSLCCLSITRFRTDRLFCSQSNIKHRFVIDCWRPFCHIWWSFAFFAASHIIAFWCFLDTETVAQIILTSLTLGAAFACKYTALFLNIRKSIQFWILLLMWFEAMKQTAKYYIVVFTRMVINIIGIKCCFTADHNFGTFSEWQFYISSQFTSFLRSRKSFFSQKINFFSFFQSIGILFSGKRTRR
jgi:hypothetical protein